MSTESNEFWYTSYYVNNYIFTYYVGINSSFTQDIIKTIFQNIVPIRLKADSQQETRVKVVCCLFYRYRHGYHSVNRYGYRVYKNVCHYKKILYGKMR